VAAPTDDARPRRWPEWASVGRVPIATPPTVPWQRPAPPTTTTGAGPGPAGSGAGGGSAASAAGAGGSRPVAGAVRELLEDLVERGLAGIEDGLAALAARRDPVRKHERRVRRARRKLGAESAMAGGLGVVAVTAGVAPGWTMAEVGFGTAAAVVGLAAAGAGRRLRQLRQHPPPAPRPRDLPRPKRPPRDCPARRPLDRLAERERALTGLLAHLGAAAEEPRAVALDAAATLRELGARATAVDRARRGAAPASAAGLGAAVATLVSQLDSGVLAYDALVVAAADAVAASATLRAGDPVLMLRLTEATDSLAGLAAGMREVAG
jgi:hypothetical protein